MATKAFSENNGPGDNNHKTGPRSDDPSNQRSALSTLKQHWPAVTCLPVALPVALLCEWIYLILSAASPLECTLTAMSLRLHTSSLELNKEMITAQHSSAVAGTCYVTRKQGQGSLDVTLLWWRQHLTCADGDEGALIASVKLVYVHTQLVTDGSVILKRKCMVGDLFWECPHIEWSYDSDCHVYFV
jgi:hypothetical protein